jgi:heme A synthase
MSVRLFRRWALGALVFTMAVVVWGGYVRASGSGAGCGAHWPNCRGEVIPREPSIQTVIEYTHRLTSGLAFLSVAIMAWLARRLYPAGEQARRWSLWALGFMVLEAVAGAALVKLELVADNASANRAVAMSVHLLITFGLLASMTLTTWAAWKRAQDGAGGPPPVLAVALSLVALVGVSGAIAALGDTLVQQSVTSPVVDTLMRLRLLHPIIAIGGTLAVIASAVGVWQTQGARSWAVAMVVLLGAQVVAGFVNVWLAAPIWLQLVHLFLADSLWVVLVVVWREAAQVKGPATALQRPSVA